MEQSFKDFNRALPKTETHLHIEGGLHWELLQQANPGKYLSPFAGQREMLQIYPCHPRVHVVNCHIR